ncbi:MAG: putative bifunctional diguanylate cyclase/phosphodiesterase [Alphaproteobacteria bacterium]
MDRTGTRTATFLVRLDRFLRMDGDDAPVEGGELTILRARALAVLGPLAGLFALILALFQLRSEVSGAGTAFGGVVGIVSFILPLSISAILLAIPIILRRTRAVGLCAWLGVTALLVALAPWPFILFGIYSRNIVMLGAVPVIATFLVSPRVGGMMMIGVCLMFLALPLLGSIGWVHQPAGVTVFDSLGHGVAAVLTAGGLYILASTITRLYNRTVEETVAARLEALDLAESDQLTGLANRRIFSRVLWERMGAAVKGGSGFALILIDLDRFKSINDTFGHATGDALLAGVARRLTRLCKDYPGCIAARLGGDEFAMICEDTENGAAAERLAARLVEAMRAPVTTDHAVVYPTVSVGLAHCPQDARMVEDLQWMADVALYAAKSEGRNRWRKSDPDMIAAVEERQILVSGMRDASFTDQLEIWYQPQTCLRTGRVVGLEALIRWNHPIFGLLMPASFVRHAEDHDLIGTLTEHVILKALEETAPWFHGGLIDQLAINISGHDLKDGTLLTALRRSLTKWDLPPTMVELEVTESFFLWNLEETFTALQALGGDGIRIALDDFGTGYSSLTYLRTLPINTIKIDKSFVFDCDTNPNSLAIVQAIIGLARSLDMETVAEGVETDGQKDVLARLGTTRMQGFQHSRPMPRTACDAFLRDAAQFLEAGPGPWAVTRRA